MSTEQKVKRNTLKYKKDMKHNPSFITRRGMWNIHKHTNFGGDIIIVSLQSPTNVIVGYGLWDTNNKHLTDISIQYNTVLKSLVEIVGKIVSHDTVKNDSPF